MDTQESFKSKFDENDRRALQDLNVWLSIEADMPADNGILLDAGHQRIHIILKALREAYTTTDRSTHEYAASRANSYLLHYLAAPQVTFQPDQVFPSADLKPRAAPGGTSPEEINAAWSIVDLATSGVLFSLRQCVECPKLFAPVRETQETCGRVCSRKRYVRSDTNKKRRREYMRKWREDND